MSKFCSSCGTELNDSATFCTNCGAPQGQPSGNPVPPQAAPNMSGAAAADATPAENVKNALNGAAQKFNNFKYKNYVIVGGIALVVIIIVIILLSIIFGGGSYKTPLDNYVKVCEKGDGDNYKNMVFMTDEQEEALEGLAKLAGQSDLDEYYEDAAQDIHDDIVEKYGDDVKVSYEIVEKEELDEDEIKKLNKYSLSSLLGSSKSSDVDITKAYKLKVEITFEGEKKEETKTKNYTVVKCNGKWTFSSSSFSVF